MADLTLDDQNLSNGTTPAGADTSQFVLTFTGQFSSSSDATFDRLQPELNQALQWVVASNGKSMVGYSPDNGNAIAQVSFIGQSFTPGIPDATSEFPPSTLRVTLQALLLDAYQDHPLVGDDLVQLGSALVTAFDNSFEYFFTDSASIEISDDRPLAFTDFALADNGFASGNVLANDIIGADDCTIDGPQLPTDAFIANDPNASGPILALASHIAGHQVVVGAGRAGGPANAVPPAGKSDPIQGQYGQLTIDGAGNWTYVQTSPAAGGATDNFVYFIEDCDGDPASAEIIITIPDQAPTAGNVNLSLDDDVLPGGNPGGLGDDPDPPIPLVGNLIGNGGDPPIFFALVPDGAPAGFSYDGSTTPGTIYINQGSVQVVTITLTNPATGAISIVQNAPISHPSLDGQPGDDAENDVLFPIGYTVTDIDGDIATGTLTLTVDDDTPVARGGTARLADGAPGNAVSLSGVINDTAGADRPGTTVFESGTYGTVITDAAGNRTYVLAPNGLTAIRALGAGEELTDQIRYRVTDSDGDSASAVLAVTLVGINDAPEFDQSQYVFLNWEDNHAFSVGASDADDDPLDYGVGSPLPQLGIVTGGEDGQFVYTPQMTTPAIDRFGLTASDPGGLGDSAQVTMLIALAPGILPAIQGLDFSGL